MTTLMKQFLLAMGTALLIVVPATSYPQQKDDPAKETTQTKTIRGQVTDNKGAPLGDVSVHAKGTTKRAVTAPDGRFSITIPVQTAVLEFSHVAMEHQEVNIAGKTELRIQLKENNSNLTDVIVVGYGTQRKANVLGSVSTFNPKEVEDLPVANLSTALKNVVPGVSVNQTAGKPGATTNLNIRNATTFVGAGGNTSPLFVIDGLVETYTTSGGVDVSGKTAFDNLDPSQIESITFLKDAAATIYGARGANGVVLVTTKRGKAGKPRLSYSGSYATEDASKMPQMLSGYDQALLLNNWVTNYRPGNVVSTEVYTPEELAYLKTHNYNWLDQAWESAHLQRHTLNISGGSDKLTFFVGGNYYDETGNLRDLYATKYGLRLGMNAKIVKGLTADITMGTDNTTLNRPSPKGVTAQADAMSETVGGLMHVPGWVPMYLDGKPVYYANLGWHPYELQNSGSYAKSKSQGLTVNATLEYKVPKIEGLSFRVQYGRNTRNNFGKEYYVSYNLYDFQQTGVHTNTGPGTNKPTGTQNVVYTNNVNAIRTIKNGNSLFESYDGSANWQLNEAVSYARKFGKHDVSIILLAEQSQTTGDNLRTNVEGQVIPGTDQYYGFSTDNTTNNASITGLTSSTGRVSYMGRFNYGFKDRYLLEAAFRRDASPNFPVNSQWGFFPSVAVGWKISEENFFKNNISFVNDLKIRFNVGLTGNDATSAFAWKNRYTSANGMLFGSSLSNGLNNAVIPNTQITWEKALYKDLGIDGNFWNRRFNFALDFYHRHQYDMLETPNTTVPNTFGGSIANQNHGVLNSWGMEAMLGYNGSAGRDFKYFINVNFSITNNKVISKYYNANTDTGWKKPVGVRADRGIEGYKATGIVRTQQEVDAWYKTHPGWTINGDSLRPGYLNFEDINGDGKITDVDQTRIADRSSSLFGMGFNLGCSWKGFRVSTNISLSVGGYTTWRKADVAPPTKDVSALVMWRDSWTAANPNAALPAIYAPYVSETSSFWLRNATAMRVNNLQFSYSLPGTLTGKWKIPECRVFITGNNLWAIINPTPYKDPASNTASDYPILRTWTFGLNLNL